MADLVTSVVAGFVGGVFGSMWLGPVGFVGGVAIGLSLGSLYPRIQAEKAAEEGAERPRIPVVGRWR